MIFRLACTLVIALLAAPPEALAWGQTGHRVTGAIAERHLSDEARAAVCGFRRKSVQRSEMKAPTVPT